MWLENIDLPLLETQMETLGRIIDREIADGDLPFLSPREIEHLEGLWNLCAHVLDDVRFLKTEK